MKPVKGFFLPPPAFLALGLYSESFLAMVQRSLFRNGLLLIGQQWCNGGVVFLCFFTHTAVGLAGCHCGCGRSALGVGSGCCFSLIAAESVPSCASPCFFYTHTRSSR
uniref:Uncharacterized protein n=1 Tax=Entomoneis paludosa TaxID=265537 RepID=A0A7S2Y9P8_9STRA